MSRENRVLILGTGISGLFTALKCARQKDVTQVLVVCKDVAIEGATRYAQGGIASVGSATDSIEEHLQDTLVAGAGLCNRDVVRACVTEGPARVRELMDWGVEFKPDLHREGGHGQRRIQHVGDRTGLAIEQALLAEVREHPRIKILENHTAIDLITEGKILKRWRRPGRCLGAYVLDTEANRVVTLQADRTVLATGGAGKVYLYTTNPDTATGDGVAMAFRAGAPISNLEFYQFHPTSLFHPKHTTFLISEALRGEGAVLRNSAGVEFMKALHPLGSLAPRDIVARAIDSEIKKAAVPHVWLDATHLDAETLRSKFPQIYSTCADVGIDIAREPIPVVPAAHYMCGGVEVDAHGQTGIQGLYAVGEVSCTGLHGANRLASNSLLEAVVFAHRVSEAMAKTWDQDEEHEPSEIMDIPLWETGRAVAMEEQLDISAVWKEIRTLMWNYVGIIRSDRRLLRARRRLAVLQEDIKTDYWNFLLTRDLIELRNLHTVASIIVESALQRHESRGLHFTVDYPKTLPDEAAQNTVIQP